MKSIQFAIMAVLVFSIGISPAFSNGLAFAIEEEQGTEREQRESTADPADRESTADPADRESTAQSEETQRSSDKDGDSDRSGTPQDCSYDVDGESTPECPNRQ